MPFKEKSNLKVMTIVGTRPEIIRLSETIKKLDIFFDHIFIHTGQNNDFELNDVFFKDLGLRSPNEYLKCQTGNTSNSISKIISSIDKKLIQYAPDCVLILGDTNSALSAIPVKRRKIPIFHMEAGNRCFNFDVPEEINRRIVDVISDINLTYSEISREYLIKENFPPDRIIVTGSPLKEVLSRHTNKIKKSSILNKLNLKKNNYFLFSFHREENVDDNTRLQKIISIINKVQNIYKKKILITLHPRTRLRLEKLGIKLNKEFIVAKPFSFTDYIKLQLNSFCVISDSGSISEESNILKFNAINLRDEHERPESFQEASTIFTGINIDTVLDALKVIKSSNNKNFNIVSSYNVNNVSDKIVKIILSYTNYVNRFKLLR